MEKTNIQHINGKFLYYAFISGAKQIINHQIELNDINVFPVEDKDTGTNLSSTVRFVLDNLKPNKSFKKTLENIANYALIGARGNSGVIFAQFIHGLNSETLNKKVITLPEFAEALHKSIPHIYKAVASPKEGTMLTVIKEWANFLNSKKGSINEFKKTIIDSKPILEKSLTETTSKLKLLNNTGLVDAGAKGFVLFINGIIHFLQTKNIKDLMTIQEVQISIPHAELHQNLDINHRFCTEAIIKNTKLDNELLKDFLNKNGDSVVVAGSKKLCRIHIHTNQPADLFQQLKNYGTITYQKVDDMIRQNEMANKRKWKIALVTDSTCDLSQELIDKYQIHVVPINLNFGESHYLDKVTLKAEQFYDLLEKEPEFPKTSQINQQAFLNLYANLAANYDAIISLHLTGKFSGTYSNSYKAAQRIQKEFNNPIHVIDSKNLSGALGLLVLKTAQNIDKGKSLDTLLKTIEKDIKQTKIYVSVKNLNSMIRGGRVSKPKGLIAKILGLNPVISMDKNGNSTMFGKTFSQKASLAKIYKHIEKLQQSNTIENYIILHANNAENARKTSVKMEEISGLKPASIVNISPVIGMHAGNGAISIAIMFNEKN